jgi:signal transduction histidine kinase
VRPRVTIFTEQRHGDVRICVCDNGIGVAAEDQQRIFGMFARVHSEKLYEGTGIGLAIVRKAAERMGGSSGVESQLGHGSTFWIQLKPAALV